MNTIARQEIGTVSSFNYTRTNPARSQQGKPIHEAFATAVGGKCPSYGEPLAPSDAGTIGSTLARRVERGRVNDTSF